MKVSIKEIKPENKNRLLSTKESFLDAFEARGGTSSLTEWAKKNPDKFYPILVKDTSKRDKIFQNSCGVHAYVLTPTAQIPKE